MKVIVDTSIPDLTEEEKEEIKERSEAGEIKNAEDNPEEFRRQVSGCKEIRMSKEVADSLEQMGITPDELAAIFIKAAKLEN